MGMDISYHPVDAKFVQETIQGYLLGIKSIEGLIPQGIQIAKNRQRAEAWALAVNDIYSGRSDNSQSGDTNPALDRLKSPSSMPLGRQSFEFETDLYIWGRPFFITVPDQARLSASIDWYLNIGDSETNLFLRQMTDLLMPGLSTMVVPDAEYMELTIEEAQDRIVGEITTLRTAFDNMSTRKPVTLPDGEECDPLSVINSYVALTVVKFGSHFRPGWMARGYVWPTKLLREAGLPTRMFTTARELFEPILKAYPEIAIEFEHTIHQNWMLGGYVPPQSVSAVRGFFEQNIETIVKPTIEEDWGDYCRLCLGKIIEAMRDAESRGFGFLEATEIYEPFGIIN